MLAFCNVLCYYIKVLWGTRKYPGVAKFGIALEWGSRGLEFESRHSDQEQELAYAGSCFFFVWELEHSCISITSGEIADLVILS